VISDEGAISEKWARISHDRISNIPLIFVIGVTNGQDFC
jgi:hypothetical protein